MLHTMFEVQSIHLQAALWMGMSLSQIKKIHSFWEWPPPSLRNNWGPRCVLFPLLLYVGKFFFSPEQDKFFFSSHVGQVFFFFFLYVGQVFVFFFLWVGQVFFFTKTSCSPPWSLMVHPIGSFTTCSCHALNLHVILKKMKDTTI